MGYCTVVTSIYTTRVATLVRVYVLPIIPPHQAPLPLYLLTSVQGFKGIKNKDFGYGGSRAGGMG